jgi:hypothetical protein
MKAVKISAAAEILISDIGLTKGKYATMVAVGILILILLGSATSDAHQDPCHARHACPSDQGTYVCGDRGHCDQCPDNLYCLGGQPRVSAQPPPVPAQPPSPKGEEASCPSVDVCFTPGEDCTDRIVKTLGEAHSSILLQAYSFTSAPIAKALVDAKKRGLRVEAILDKWHGEGSDRIPGRSYAHAERYNGFRYGGMNMTKTRRTVFVLGAGFTKAFLPQAPLLTDDYDGDRLADRFESFPHARRVLNLERSKNANGQINIERLMTRLDGGMPYDFEHGASEELALLLSEIKRAFRDRLEKAKSGPCHADEMAALARYCVDNAIPCITFNYDDVFDRALWEVEKVSEYPTVPYWHPDGGYGFFCHPSEECIRHVNAYMDQSAMLLLKLHGSINWRVRRGYTRPYAVDALVHHETWLPRYRPRESDPELIALHLEPEPFIVPPVLVKSALMEQPILRLTWSLAYQALSKAAQVYFIGYSFPVTDIAANFLFGEALQHLTPSQISVVNLPSDEEVKEILRTAYQKVFPGIPDDHFEFRDALDWARDIVQVDG